MTLEDFELEAPDLMRQDAYDRRRARQRLEHWHPSDPDYWDPEDDFEEPPEQEISSSGVELLEKDGQQLEKYCQKLLKKVDNAE